MWTGSDDDGDYEIFLYDGVTTTQLTNNTTTDWQPEISGDNVVWARTGYGTEPDIFLYDGATTSQLTNDIWYERKPQISGNNVIWLNGGDDVVLYDGATTTQLTNHGKVNGRPQVSGDNVVWEVRDGSVFEIYLYDGVTTTQLTSHGGRSQATMLSGLPTESFSTMAQRPRNSRPQEKTSRSRATTWSGQAPTETTTKSSCTMGQRRRS